MDEKHFNARTLGEVEITDPDRLKNISIVINAIDALLATNPPPGGDKFAQGDIENFKRFLTKNDPDTSPYTPSWSPMSKWGKEMAKQVLKPDLAVANMYEAGIIPGTMTDYFKTEYSENLQVFYECQATGVGVGQTTKLVETMSSYQMLSKNKQAKLANIPYRFDTLYR